MTQISSNLFSIVLATAYFKGPPLGLRQYLTTESPLNLMKNIFYFMLKALFVLEIFTFLSLLVEG